MSSGTYSVEILYAEDCSIDSTFTIVGLGELIVTIDESESPVCVSDTTGIISVSISGGTPEYTLAWTKEGVPFSIEEDLSDLGIGVYELSVTDAFGCIGSLSLNLEAQEEVIVETTLVEIDCFENCNASITSTIIQAQEPITFTWSDVNGIISNAEFIENICAGTYELVVMDGAGCEYIETFIIDEPEEMEVLEDITNISCNGLAEGAILLTVSGGSAPYSTSLPSIESNPGEFVLDNLIAGSYVVDVTDDEGCVVSVPFELTEPEALLVDLSFEDPICFGESSGSITLVVSGGSEPYSIEWVELGVFDELIQSDLPSGDYNILITDAQGCEESLTVTLEDPLEITVVETTNPVLCNGDSTGSIELEVSNPIGNLNVLWVGNVINNTELNQFDLQAGVYEVTLTDDNGCEENSAYEILESPELEVTETIINPLCFGEQGEISIEINGGQEPYDVSWAEIEAPNQQSITDLPTGIYTVAVTDANLCEVTASYQITLPDEIIITAEVTQPDCVLQSGTIEVVNITGGAGSYSFIWLEIDAPDQNLVENLASGDYTIQVTDASNCITEEVYTITEPGVLAVSSEVTNVLCNGENTGSILLEASGGLEPYTAVWTPVLDASLAQENLTAGVYEVTLTDDNGCEFNNTFEITAPDEIIITEDVSVLNCSEDLGAIEISIEGGIEPYGIAWGGIEAPGETLLTELSAGDYSVTVIDDSECEVTEAYFITAPEAIEIVEVITQPNCFGELGVISLEITGGTGLYTIEWTGIEADGDTEILDLIAGTYTVTVTDENGCEEEESYEIILINELAANVNMTQPECFTSTRRASWASTTVWAI